MGGYQNSEDSPEPAAHHTTNSPLHYLPNIGCSSTLLKQTAGEVAIEPNFTCPFQTAPSIAGVRLAVFYHFPYLCYFDQAIRQS